jgi:tRNA-dihydrouridine synthase
MRRGLDDSQESRDRFFEIITGAFQAGIDAATIHGRTVIQRYIGPSHWSFLREVKQMFPERTILGSGDLFTATDCVNMMATTGIDGVTIARGAIGNPWIFTQARALAAGQALPSPPSLPEQREVMLQHWQLTESLYGPQRTPTLMRKFGIKYAASHPDYLSVRPLMARLRTGEEFRQILDEWYLQDRPGVYPTIAIGEACQESCG